MRSQLIEDYRQFLKSSGNSVNTVKNYVSDLSTFVDYLKNHNQYFSLLTLPFVLSSRTLEKYFQWLSETLPRTTANRKLAGLRKFINFAVSRSLLDANYVGVITNIPPPPQQEIISTVEKYRAFMEKEGYASNTIKGYISDVKHHLLLRSSSATADAVLVRRSIAVKKFLEWKSRRSLSVPLIPPAIVITSATHPGATTLYQTLTKPMPQLVWRLALVAVGGVALIPFLIHIFLPGIRKVTNIGDYRTSRAPNTSVSRFFGYTGWPVGENGRSETLRNLIFKPVLTKIITFSLNPRDRILSPIPDLRSADQQSNRRYLTNGSKNDSQVLGNASAASTIERVLQVASQRLYMSTMFVHTILFPTMVDPTLINTEQM